MISLLKLWVFSNGIDFLDKENMEIMGSKCKLIDSVKIHPLLLIFSPEKLIFEGIHTIAPIKETRYIKAINKLITI